MNILILGHKGMLGDGVYRFYKNIKKYSIITTDLRWPSLEFKQFVIQSEFDWVINCIGSIPSKYNEFDININLPLFLVSNNKKVINPGSDISDDSDYSFSKNIISNLSKKIEGLYNIRCSIIGMGGFLKSVLDRNITHGYTNHYWNGVTTIEWAKVSHSIISGYYKEKVIIPSTKCITKFDLSNLILDKYFIDYKTIPIMDNKDVYRCLEGNIPVSNIEKLIDEFLEYYHKN